MGANGSQPRAHLKGNQGLWVGLLRARYPRCIQKVDFTHSHSDARALGRHGHPHRGRLCCGNGLLGEVRQDQNDDQGNQRDGFERPFPTSMYTGVKWFSYDFHSNVLMVEPIYQGHAPCGGHLAPWKFRGQLQVVSKGEAEDAILSCGVWGSNMPTQKRRTWRTRMQLSDLWLMNRVLRRLCYWWMDFLQESTLTAKPPEQLYQADQQSAFFVIGNASRKAKGNNVVEQCSVDYELRVRYLELRVEGEVFELQRGRESY